MISLLLYVKEREEIMGMLNLRSKPLVCKSSPTPELSVYCDLLDTLDGYFSSKLKY